MFGGIELENAPSVTEVTAVLSACGLPSDDIEHEFLRHFVVARQDRVPVGLAGVQLLGTRALLRSVAVLDSHRSAGLGSRLVRAAEERARDAGIREVFLLTNDAQQFFARHGYVEASRCSAPAELQATAQFKSTCCEGATLMFKRMAG